MNLITFEANTLSVAFLFETLQALAVPVALQRETALRTDALAVAGLITTFEADTIPGALFLGASGALPARPARTFGRAAL